MDDNDNVTNTLKMPNQVDRMFYKIEITLLLARSHLHLVFKITSEIFILFRLFAKFLILACFRAVSLHGCRQGTISVYDAE